MQDYEMFSLLILLPNFLQKSPNVRVFVLSTQGAKLYVCWQTDMASYKNVSYVD